jgi:hypothetical protein
MEIGLIVLAIVVLILLCIVAWLEACIKTLEKRCDRLERQNRRFEVDILDLCSNVDLLKTANDSRKKLELMVKRKEMMTNYLAEHYSDSSIELVGHLYDIANGIVEER